MFIRLKRGDIEPIINRWTCPTTHLIQYFTILLIGIYNLTSNFRRILPCTITFPDFNNDVKTRN